MQENKEQLLQEIIFFHPLEQEKSCTLLLDCGLSWKQAVQQLIEQGFLPKKRGGYHLILDDELVQLGKSIADYLPANPPKQLAVQVHGLLSILI